MDPSTRTAWAARKIASGTQLGKERPLGRDRPMDCRVIHGGQQFHDTGVVSPTLNGKRPLSHLREQDRLVQSIDYRRGQAEPIKRSGRHHDRRETLGPVQFC